MTAPARVRPAQQELALVEEPASTSTSASLGGHAPGGQVLQESAVTDKTSAVETEARMQEALEAEPANLRKLRSPQDPTLEDIEEHEDSGHCPPRPWCPACCAGYGKIDQHRRLLDEESKSVPTISMDYGYLGLTPQGPMDWFSCGPL